MQLFSVHVFLIGYFSLLVKINRMIKLQAHALILELGVVTLSPDHLTAMA
jgi:hypothetical protein